MLFIKAQKVFFLLMFCYEKEEENLKHIWCFPNREQKCQYNHERQRGIKYSILMVSGIKAWWNKLKTTIMTSFSIYSVLSRLHLSSSIWSHHIQLSIPQ